MTIVSQAQEQYDADPKLKALLERALTSPTVRRRRRAAS